MLETNPILIARHAVSVSHQHDTDIVNFSEHGDEFPEKSLFIALSVGGKRRVEFMGRSVSRDDPTIVLGPNGKIGLKEFSSKTLR